MKIGKSLSIISFALIVAAFSYQTATANIITTQQARTEHMRACLSNGGKKNICECSFDSALQSLSAENLLNVNRALSNNIPADKQHLDILAKVTRSCAKDIAAGTYVKASAAEQTSSALPQIAPPPSFADLDSVAIPAPPPLQKSTPDFKVDTTEYFEEPEIDMEAERARLAAAERARQNQFKVSDLKESYKGQYDDLFFQAVARGDLQAIRAINQYLPSVDIVDDAGNTPLITASGIGQPAIVSFLLTNKADVDHRNKQGQQALHAATFAGHQSVIQLLLEYKAQIDSTYAGGLSALNLAIMAKNPQIVQNLIIAGANTTTPMADGNMPIHIATAANSPEIIAILRDYGADLNVENAQGYTPLMVATSQNNTAAASALLALGADFTRVDIYGRNAAQIAQTLGHRQILNLILTVQEQQYGNIR